MSHPDHEDDEDLKPTFGEGYKPGEKKTVGEYAQLDAGDESLNRWKASLGINADGSVPAAASGPKVTVLSLSLTSPTLINKSIRFDLTDQAAVAALAKNPITIKEGVEYAVAAEWKVNYEVTSGLRYIQVVKRSGIKVDKMESMLGSYGPGDTHSKVFATEESPSGMIARSGTYNVQSRFIDDDGEVYSDFKWAFKIGKEW